MKIIISPSKLQTVAVVPGVEGTRVAPAFEKERVAIMKALSPLSYEALGKALGIKGTLLDGAYAWVHGKHSGDFPQNLGHAIATYTGIVFKEIEHDQYDDNQRAYLERHLRILSAYYGVLTPFTEIAEYRLDMTAHIPSFNLYNHWHHLIHETFNQEDIIVNLASKEFSKMLDRKKLKAQFLDIDFKEEQSDGTLKIVTVRAKQCRGLMTNFMVQNGIEAIEGLKGFNEAGYEFDPDLSGPWHYVFIKRNPIF